MILGLLANVAGYTTSKAVLKTLTKEVVTNSTVVDKVLIPAGTFIISCMVGDACSNYAEKQVEEAKNTIAGVKEIGKAMREAKAEVNEEPETHNVFDDAESEEVDENGEG